MKGRETAILPRDHRKMVIKDGIVFTPIGKTKLTPMQKKDKAIRDLIYWVAILGAVDAIYTILFAAMLLEMLGVFG